MTKDVQSSTHMHAEDLDMSRKCIGSNARAFLRRGMLASVTVVAPLESYSVWSQMFLQLCTLKCHVPQARPKQQANEEFVVLGGALKGHSIIQQLMLLTAVHLFTPCLYAGVGYEQHTTVTLESSLYEAHNPHLTCVQELDMSSTLEWHSKAIRTSRTTDT